MHLRYTDSSEDNEAKSVAYKSKQYAVKLIIKWMVHLNHRLGHEKYHAVENNASYFALNYGCHHLSIIILKSFLKTTSLS